MHSLSNCSEFNGTQTTDKLSNEHSTLVLVMTLFPHTTTHYLHSFWATSLWSYGLSTRLGNYVTGFMISDESGNRFFPTAVTDYWQDRAGIAYQQADFSEFFPCLRTFSYQSRMTLPFEWVWVPRNFIICLYDFESFQYPAFTTSFTNRSTGAVCCSTVFDMFESPQFDF